MDSVQRFKAVYSIIQHWKGGISHLSGGHLQKVENYRCRDQKRSKKEKGAEIWKSPEMVYPIPAP